MPPKPILVRKGRGAKRTPAPGQGRWTTRNRPADPRFHLARVTGTSLRKATFVRGTERGVALSNRPQFGLPPARSVSPRQVGIDIPGRHDYSTGPSFGIESPSTKKPTLHVKPLPHMGLFYANHFTPSPNSASRCGPGWPARSDFREKQAGPASHLSVPIG